MQSRADLRAWAHRVGSRSTERVEPRDHVGPQLGWREDLGVVEQVEHPRAERGAVHDRQRDHDRAVASTLDHRALAELVDHPGGAWRVDEDLGVDRLVLPVRERIVAHQLTRIDPRWWREPTGTAALDPAVDAIDAEGTRRVAVLVTADDVPMAPAEHDAVRLQATRLVAVGERDRGVGAHGFEELRERRGDGEIGECRVGALTGDAAELAQRVTVRRRPRGAPR